MTGRNSHSDQLQNLFYFLFEYDLLRLLFNDEGVKVPQVIIVGRIEINSYVLQSVNCFLKKAGSG